MPLHKGNSPDVQKFIKVAGAMLLPLLGRSEGKRPLWYPLRKNTAVF